MNRSTIGSNLLEEIVERNLISWKSNGVHNASKKETQIRIFGNFLLKKRTIANSWESQSSGQIQEALGQEWIKPNQTAREKIQSKINNEQKN